MKAIGLVVAFGIIAVVVVMLMLRRDSDREQAIESPTARADVEDGSESLEVLRGSEFDLKYGSSNSTPQEDMELLAGLLQNAWILVKDADRIPFADNRDFARFLCGENRHRVAWIPPGHRSLSESGEIVDRWGTALFFHRVASRHTGLRSAGPDQKFWTEDDVTHGP